MTKTVHNPYVGTVISLLIIAVIFWVVGHYFLQKTVQQEEAIDRIAEAAQHAKKGEIEQAIGEYRMAIERSNSVTAYNNLASLKFKQGDWMGSIRTIDQGIAAARQTGDPALVQLLSNRRDILKQIGPRLESSPDLKAYVCEHNQFVTGASDTKDAAPGELKRFMRDSPIAEIGRPSTLRPDYVPIIADFFLNCSEASDVINHVRAKLGTEPFVGRWYGTCEQTCPGLPQRIGPLLTKER